MEYKYLKARGFLNEAGPAGATALAPEYYSSPAAVTQLLASGISPAVVELLPESVARENVVMPLASDGETIVCAAANPEDIGFADKLRFILAKNIRLVAAPADAIIKAINHHYGQPETESVDSMLADYTDTDSDGYETGPERTAPRAPPRSRSWFGRPEVGRYLGEGIVEFRKGAKPREEGQVHGGVSRVPGMDQTPWLGGSGMFYYVIEEGQRVLMRRPDGTIEVLVGPKRVWRGRSVFTRMQHYVAHPSEFLIIRFRDGRQEHLAGPAEIWLDPRVHQQVTREDALQLAAKEAVVVYSRREGTDEITRRIVYGPGLFIPRPGEWLHTFSWHASHGGHQGVEKVPNALVFQKLWLMPDQMYHDVHDVRTADDAVLTIRLMLFFELVDIERMLDATHDPIGDFVNAATSDVVDFTGKHSFESFKRNTERLNELETYRQLIGRAAQCGYRINKVVYRGYGAPANLQQMHDQAIEARTRLQLERATNQQAQELEDYKLDCQIARSNKRRTEQTAEVEHDLELAGKKQEAEIRQREAQQAFLREQKRREAELQQEICRRQDEQQREHLAALHGLGVDLTAFLTQARADRVIELRGAAGAHVHLDQTRAGSHGDAEA
jgi:hypothetical protein